MLPRAGAGGVYVQKVGWDGGESAQEGASAVVEFLWCGVVSANIRLVLSTSKITATKEERHEK